MDIIGLLNDLTGGNLLLWKVVGTSLVLLGAGAQVLLAARFWGATSVPAMTPGTAAINSRPSPAAY